MADGEERVATRETWGSSGRGQSGAEKAGGELRVATRGT